MPGDFRKPLCSPAEGCPSTGRAGSSGAAAREHWSHAAKKCAKTTLKQVVALVAQLAKDRLSDAGGPGFESQTGRVTGKSIPRLWRDKRPAIKGLRPPEHHAGHSVRTKKTPESKTTQNNTTLEKCSCDCCPWIPTLVAGFAFSMTCEGHCPASDLCYAASFQISLYYTIRLEMLSRVLSGYQGRRCHSNGAVATCCYKKTTTETTTWTTTTMTTTTRTTTETDKPSFPSYLYSAYLPRVCLAYPLVRVQSAGSSMIQSDVRVDTANGEPTAERCCLRRTAAHQCAVSFACAWGALGTQRWGSATANLRNNMDFRGFDWSRILILGCGIPRPMGSFPESSNHPRALSVRGSGPRGIGKGRDSPRQRFSAEIGNFVSQDFIFVCAMFVEVLRRIAEICGDCNFPLQYDQQVLRRFAETTNPLKNCETKTSKSWLVKFLCREGPGSKGQGASRGSRAKRLSAPTKLTRIL